MNKENINTLIACLVAIENYAKDIHYNCPGDEFYGLHLLADRIGESASDFIDSLKETSILGTGELVLPSSEYLKQALTLIPEIDISNNEINFTKMKSLLTNTISLADRTQVQDRATSALLDNICENLQNSLGLLNIQLRGE